MATYEHDIDRWIIGACRAGAQDFWNLVSLLPAVYPTVVRQAVERLIASSSVPAYLAVERPTWKSSGAIKRGGSWIANSKPTCLRLALHKGYRRRAFGTSCCID